MSFVKRGRLVFTLYFVALLLAGCATLPAFTPQPPIHSIAASQSTQLGRIAAAAQPDRDLSGFRLLPSGDFALHARLEFARRAEVSLDLQYYQIENDQIGRTVLRAVRDAALRGVRVRVIVDDLYTSGTDELLRAFAATPNVQLRLFNPFPSGRSAFASRFAASLLDFGRVNHRMHNKLFLADGAVAVAGGRNLGNHYFGRSADDNFVDLDIVAAGAVMSRLTELFDAYWNSPYVRPAESIIGSELTQEQLRAHFEVLTGPSTTAAPESPPPNDILGYGPVGDDLDNGKLDLTWAIAEAYADDPARVVGKQTQYGGVPLLDVDSVRYNVIEQIRRAQTEVTVVSPYLITGANGIAEISTLRQRGVRMGLITNSLASTDEPLAYMAYRRYRPALLRLGVEVWELGSVRSGKSVRLGVFGSRVGRLHAKSVVVDGNVLFVGSMNFDPRSASSNTELGLIIHSEPLARQQLKMLGMLKEQGAYRLQMSEDGKRTQWTIRESDREVILETDPDTGFWDRTMPTLLAPLVPESLL